MRRRRSFSTAQPAVAEPFALRFAPYKIPRLDTGLRVLDAQDALADRLGPAFADRARP